MNAMMKTGSKPGHAMRPAADRWHGDHSASAIHENESAATTRSVVQSAPCRPPICDLSKPTHAPGLGRNLHRLATRLRATRELARAAEELASLRKVQQAD